jgi:hypothetical protein
VVESLFSQGLLVNAAPDGPVNHDPEIDGLRAAGMVVNCPPVFVGASSLDPERNCRLVRDKGSFFTERTVVLALAQAQCNPSSRSGCGHRIVAR